MKIGDEFGKLTVVSFDGKYVVCKCNCGNTKRIRKTSLTMKVSNMTIDEISNLQRSIIARDYGKTLDKQIDFEHELEVMNTLADLTEIKIKLRMGAI